MRQVYLFWNAATGQSQIGRAQGMVILLTGVVFKAKRAKNLPLLSLFIGAAHVRGVRVLFGGWNEAMLSCFGCHLFVHGCLAAESKRTA